MNRNKVLCLVCIVLVFFTSTGCFKNLPNKYVVYSNDFESSNRAQISVFDFNGMVDTLKIVPFNNNKVLGFFNNNSFVLKVDGMPTHNAIKIEFDLLIHDKWQGNYLRPGSNNVPDVWQMQLEGIPVYITTFSNDQNRQSYPLNYDGFNASLPRANAWNPNLPGVCALKDQSNGSTLYKIEYTTAHTSGSVSLACNDALQPFRSFCEKSWSIDNLKVTAINYN